MKYEEAANSGFMVMKETEIEPKLEKALTDLHTNVPFIKDKCNFGNFICFLQ